MKFPSFAWLEKYRPPTTKVRKVYLGFWLLLLQTFKQPYFQPSAHSSLQKISDDSSFWAFWVLWTRLASFLFTAHSVGFSFYFFLLGLVSYHWSMGFPFLKCHWYLSSAILPPAAIFAFVDFISHLVLVIFKDFQEEAVKNAMFIPPTLTGAINITFFFF